MVLDVLDDGIDQLGYASEGVALQALLVEVAEEALDDVEPRAACGNEVDVETRMPLQPALDFLVFVRGVAVHDEVEIEFIGRLFIDHSEELDPLLVPMPFHAGGDDFAITELDCGEQSSRSVPLVVMSHRAASTLHER